MKKTFSLLVIALFLIEIIAPFSYAQATPSGGTCRISAITDAERNTLWQNALKTQVNQITDTSVGDALNQKQNEAYTDPFSPNQKIVSPDVFKQQIPLTTIASWVNEDPKEIAKAVFSDFDENKNNVNELGLTIPEALVYAKTRGQAKEDSLKAQLKQLGLMNEDETLAPTPTPKPYEGMKITIPDSDPEKADFSIQQLVDAQAINPQSCILDDEIQGRVTYFGSLSNDLVYCNKDSPECNNGQFPNPANGKIEETETNQYLKSDNTQSLLSLNGGGNIVVPAFYEDWISFTGKYNQIDFLTSLVQGVYAVRKQTTTTAILKEKQENFANLKEEFGRDAQEFENLQLLRDTPGVITDKLNALHVSQDEISVYDALLDKLRSDLAGKDATPEDIAKAEALIKNLQTSSTITNSQLKEYLGGAIPKIRDPTTGTISDYAGDLEISTHGVKTDLGNYETILEKQKSILDKRNERDEIQEEIKRLRDSEPALNKLNDLASKRLVTSYFIGGAWLGPARLAYSASNGLIFTITRQDSQYLRVYAGKNSKDVGKDFRDATNFLGSGRIQEILADYMGGTFTPDKAFKAGQLFIINRPKTASSVDESINSLTGISSTGVNWNIYSNWKGNSIAVNFEDLSLLPNTEKYTSLPMIYYTAQGNVPDPLLNLDRKDVADFYSGILQLSLPFVISRGLNQYSALYALSTGLLVNQYVLDIDTDEFKGIDCSKEHLDTLKNYYRIGKASEWILQTLMPALPVIQSSYVSKSTILQSLPLIGSNSPLRGVINDGVNLVNTLNVPQAFELYWGNKALQYVADCKDNQYKVFNYQLLESRKTLEQREAELSEDDPISKLINKIPISQGKLTLSEAAKETFYSELDLSNDVEVLNLKSDLTDQTGFVQPTQLKHVHIEQSSWSIKGKLYEKLSGSPDSCIPNEVLVNSDGSAYQLGKDGLRKINSDGSIAFEFDSPEWADRALSALRNQEIARIILPNKIIYTQLACSSEFMQVNNIGAATLSQTSCPASDCIKEKIKEVTNREVGSDLTPFIGQVTSIDTSLGRLVFDGQQINFVSTKGSKPGVTETNSNAAAAITGDGKVIIKTPAGEIQAGDLLTIYSKKAKIEHNPETHEIAIFLYLLAEGNKNFFNGFSTNLATTTLDDGSTIETPKIEIRGKTGFEEATSELNDALKSIQGEGGVLSFETPDAQYLFTKDAAGNDVLRRIDKATGEVTDYKITGPITRNADGSFNIPTDKGPITINFGQNEKGEPAVSVKGPDFEEVLATLLAARGQNGILAFNPSTGAISIYNGQDLPLNPAFATNGIGFSGGQDGTRGVPEQNPFAIPRNNNPQPTRQPTDLGALPSWPENVALAILMLTTILAGVLFARNQD